MRFVCLFVLALAATAATAQPAASSAAATVAPPDTVAAHAEPGMDPARAEPVVWSPSPALIVVAPDSAALAALAVPAAPVEAAGVHLATGTASYYGERFRGRRTASGERFNPDALTAAHRTLPFGTRLRVVHERTGRSVVVRVTDRGPFHGARILDLSKAAARRIGMVASGTARVRIERL
ncbi:septal ring lytic transglycosylase RlpA family protein [Rubrivirga sp. IMCC45206]|uniref:septal ring lytic transglycosylase RlpA family protein n=1 Tax=Rubrivirga sp. IMCC45206 TaxID=3391614 RepID=UPI00398FA5F9